MNLEKIDGVRELTLKECEEINGGGIWSEILKRLVRVIAGEIALNSLQQAIGSLFS